MLNCLVETMQDAKKYLSERSWGRGIYLLSLQPYGSRDFKMGNFVNTAFFWLRLVRPWIVFVRCLKNILNFFFYKY